MTRLQLYPNLKGHAPQEDVVPNFDKQMMTKRSFLLALVCIISSVTYMGCWESGGWADSLQTPGATVPCSVTHHPSQGTSHSCSCCLQQTLCPGGLPELFWLCMGQDGLMDWTVLGSMQYRSAIRGITHLHRHSRDTQTGSLKKTHKHLGK